MREIERRAWSLSALTLNLQGAMNIASQFAATGRLLGQGDEPMGAAIKWNRKDLTFEDAELTFALHIFLSEAGGGAGILSALEKAIPPEMPASDRSALFQKMGSLLDRNAGKKRARKNEAMSS